MSRLSEIIALCLQEREERRSGATTIVELLRERMDGAGSGSVVGRLSRRKSLQERLGLGCCGGPIWGSRTATMSVRDDDDDDVVVEEDMGQSLVQEEAQQEIEVIDMGRNPTEDLQEELDCISHPPAPATPGMNLAAALAAERHYREVQDINTAINGPSPRLSPVRPNGPNEVEPGTPLRVSLLRLLEESDGMDDEKKEDVGHDQVCCVCMVRKKGAAFIPCGHTFCRVCSRELWLNRGSCPLCNRSTLEILDIF